MVLLILGLHILKLLILLLLDLWQPSLKLRIGLLLNPNNIFGLFLNFSPILLRLILVYKRILLLLLLLHRILIIMVVYLFLLHLIASLGLKGARREGFLISPLILLKRRNLILRITWLVLVGLKVWKGSRRPIGLSRRLRRLERILPNN
jgi:hypothetical protein